MELNTHRNGFLIMKNMNIPEKMPLYKEKLLQSNYDYILLLYLISHKYEKINKYEVISNKK